jgi:hypothetical protein
MSGAPVIICSWSHHLFDSGSFLTDDRAASRFVVVYSGRLWTNDKEEAQIGMVSPASFIDEIIAGRRSTRISQFANYAESKTASSTASARPNDAESRGSRLFMVSRTLRISTAALRGTE